MNSIDGLTDDQQVEFDQLTQEQGDDLYLAPTQASHSSSSDPAPSRCCTTISTQQQHWRHEGRRQPQQQAPARCASSSGSAGSVACHHNNHQGTPAAHHGHGRGQGPGRGYHQHYRNRKHRGDTGDGHRSGLPPTRAGGRLLRRRNPSAGAASGAARAEARAEQNLDVMIKDAMGVALREHLCADNSERYRLTPGSYRVPAVPEEARSAAADAALAARGDKLPPSPPLPLPPIALVSGSDSSSGWGYGGGASSICASASGSGSAIEAPTGCRDGGDGVGVGCGSGSGGGGGGGGNLGGASGASPGGSASGASTGCRDVSGGVGGRCDGGNDGSGGGAAGGGEVEGTRKRSLFPRIENLPKVLQPKAARPAAFEKHTKEFGSRFLERTGFDGRSRSREIEYVATLVGKLRAGAQERGGDTGGLGHKHDEAAAAAAAAEDSGSVPVSAVSAPCDMDASRQLGDPPKTYYGIKVEFPFETPMVPQDQMMQRIIAALKSKRHALLESPTGTGKSAAMLCASLAWQRDELFRTGKAPQIFYGARTHTQLEQMVKVLKSLPYRPTMATLGSRARLCINPMVVGDGVAKDDEPSAEDEGEDNNDDSNERGWGQGPRGAGGGETRGGGGRRRRRQKRNSNSSMRESCQALRSKADRQRKHNKFLNLPGGGRVPYDQDAPDLTLDLANIEGRLTEKEKEHAACPFYRSMSAPKVARAAHEFARPRVGLAGAHDGTHAIEDLRAFCGNPLQALSSETNVEVKAEGRARQRGGCGSGHGKRAAGGCGSGGRGGGGECGGGCGSNGGESWRATNSSGVAVGGVAVGGGGGGGGGIGASAAAPPGYIDLSYDTSDDDDVGAGAAGSVVTAAGSAGRGTGVDVASPGDSTAAAAAAGGGQGLSETKEDQADPHLLACPYYLSMALAKQAQIVLMPYNYILDPSIRSAMSLALEGAVVILDEAHNVEGVCRDAGSLEVSLLDMVAMASDLCDCSQLTACSLGANLLLKFVMKLLHFTSRESRTLEAFEIETDFEEPPPGARKKKQQEVIKKHWACDSAGSMFWAAFVGREEDASTSHASLIRAMEDMKLGLQEGPEPAGGAGGEGKEDEMIRVTAKMTPALNNLERVLFVTGLALHHPHDYSVNVMSWDNVEKRKLPAHTRTSTRHASCPLGNSPFSRSSYVPAKMCRLNIWLMFPSVVFDEVPAQTHSVILTSGTLSPLHSLRAELGRSFGERLLPFPQQALEANHVINPGRQLRVIPVGHSPDNKTLTCKKVNTDDDEFVEEIGRTVVALAKHIPAGVLVFLSSYKLLQRAVAIWRKCEVWADLEGSKGVIVEEPEAAADFKAAKRRYEDAVDGGRGGRGRGDGSAGGSAILLAVYRGKMSEGISFNDHYARGVLCVGIPYPNLGDPKIVAKKCYNDWKSLGRKPEAKDRGGAGRRSWPDVCAAGDHKYGSAAANQGRSSSTSSSNSNSSSSGGVVGGGTAVRSAAGSGEAGAGAVGGRSGAGDVGGREGAVVGERGGGGGGMRPARIVASRPPKVSEDGEAAVSLAALGEEPAVKAEMAAVKADTAETAAEAEATEAVEAEAVAAEMAASRAAAKAAAKAAHDAGKALLSGSNWYAQEAFRAQNQALGRCIRHVYDYGVICLIDERIRAGEWKHVKFLAKWMRDLRGEFPSFEHVVDTIDQFFASAPGFVREEKERAAVLRQQASVRRRRAKETAVAVAAQGAPGGSGGDGGGGLMSAEPERPPVGMEVEAAPLAIWGGGSEDGGAGSGGGSGSSGTLSGSCSKTAGGGGGGGGGGGVRRPLSVVDEGVRNHRQRNEPSALVTPPPPLTLGDATPSGGLSSSVSGQPASDNTARDGLGEAGFSSSEGTNGEAPVAVGQLVDGVYGDRDRGVVGCRSSGSGGGGGGGRRRSAGVQEAGEDSDVVDLTAMDVALTQEHEEESAASLMYDMMM